MTNQESQAEPTQTTSIPDLMSEPCSRFFTEHWELGTFLSFVLLLAHERDQAIHNAATTLLGDKDLDAHQRAAIGRTARELMGAVDAVLTRTQLMLQMALCRGVDNYLTYLSDVLTLILTTRPEALQSAEEDDPRKRKDDAQMVRLADILRFPTREELLRYLVEEKVDRLSFKSMSGLAKFLSRRLGFELLEDPLDLEKAIRIVAQRNIIGHNRAVVNRRYRQQVKDTTLREGERLVLDWEEVGKDIEFLGASVCDLERRGGEKFDFERTVSGEPHRKRITEAARTLDRSLKTLQAILPRPASSPAQGK